MLRQSELRLKNNCDTAPDVFVVYYPENEKHIRNVATFVKKLRKQGIDATCEMFESQADNDRGFYMYSKLVESEYVFVVCSETLYEYSKLKTSDNMDGKCWGLCLYQVKSFLIYFNCNGLFTENRSIST